jgi:hypothetical protein
LTIEGFPVFSTILPDRIPAKGIRPILEYYIWVLVFLSAFSLVITYQYYFIMTIILECSGLPITFN